MIRKFLGLGICGLLLFLSVPHVSTAYLATNQTAVKLNDSTFLFTITYRFSYLGYELSMPISSIRKSEYSKATPSIGYALLKNDGTTFTDGETYSIVLSDAKVVGNRYFVPNSKVGYFTIVTILKLPKNYIDNTAVGTGVHMIASTMPFVLSKPGKYLPSQLALDQLTTYVTPTVTLK